MHAKDTHTQTNVYTQYLGGFSCCARDLFSSSLTLFSTLHLHLGVAVVVVSNRTLVARTHSNKNENNNNSFVIMTD